MRRVNQRTRRVEAVVMEVKIARDATMKGHKNGVLTGLTLKFLIFIKNKFSQNMMVAEMLVILIFHVSQFA